MKRYVLMLLMMAAMWCGGHAEVQKGRIALTEAPVNIWLPEDFSFIDGPTARGYFKQQSMAPDSVINRVVGIIVPDTVLTDETFRNYWVVSYETPGHVQDERAANMSFNWIMEALRLDPDVSYECAVNWAWKPSYDAATHHLSIPVMYKTVSDSAIFHRDYLFGKDGVMILEPVVDPAQKDWLRQAAPVVADAIDYRAGSRYEDFNPKKEHVSYMSVSAYLQGLKNVGTGHNTGAGNKESIPFTFFKWVGIVGGIILAVMLVLMGLVRITDGRSETSRTITRAGVNVLLRLGVFVCVYLLLFLVGIGLIGAVTMGVMWVFTHGINLRLGMVLLAVLLSTLVFVYGIIRSLFISSRSKPDPNLIEVSPTEAPQLFSVIREVAESVGEPMPGKVYLSPQVNASVAYAHPFRSLFMSGKKNLTIGLGLVYGLRTDELKAIIAHEYGHFSQKSMRVGSTVAIGMTIITNILNSPNTSIIQPLLKKTAQYVQRGYMKLSRALEYHADEVSRGVAGNDVVISALCKTEINGMRFDNYTRIVSSIFNAKKVVPVSLWDGYGWFLELMPELDGIEYAETGFVEGPLGSHTQSKVNMKNPWVSHPSLKERIDNINKSVIQSSSTLAQPARDIVPFRLYGKVSDAVYSQIGVKSGNRYKEPDYLPVMKTDLEENTFPLSLRVFFNRQIHPFNIGEVSPAEGDLDADEIFNDKNRRLMERFLQEAEDYRLMMAFKDGEIKEKILQYEGKVYNRKNVPVERQLKVIQQLEPLVKDLDIRIARLALAKSADPDRIRKAYDDIFYSEAVLNHIRTKIIPRRDALAKVLGSGGKVSEEEFSRRQSMLTNFKEEMSVLLDRQLEISRLAPVIHVDMPAHLKTVDDVWLGGDSIEGATVQYLMTLPDEVAGLFEALIYYSKKLISDTIEGKPLLLYWNNTVGQKLAESRDGDSSVD